MNFIPAIEPTTKSATRYLKELKFGTWYRVDSIPVNIQTEVIEILITGKISNWIRVEENDDWTAFRLVAGKSAIPINQ